ncbi:MAG: glycosyltransferase, partial [Chloroflexi bacterium]|nr:glycosyltransferase [Chloroflexota bacterium]
KSKGDYLVFLNNDTQIIAPGWIEEMLMLCQREDVGIVGAKLIHADNTMQHGGVILGIGGVAANAFGNFPRESDGYMRRLSAVHNLSAVTAACMMTKRAVFKQVGGFEKELIIDFNDVDYCMKVREAGYLVAWTPYCEIYHYEQKTRGVAESDEEKARFAAAVQYMQGKWGSKLTSDPYYSPNLTLDKADFSLRV